MTSEFLEVPTTQLTRLSNNPPTGDATSTQLASLLEALLSYAIDPAQWERLAAELDAHGASIEHMDTSEFLTHLSHAESLAWQLKNEAEVVTNTTQTRLLLDQDHRVLEGSANLAELISAAHAEPGEIIKHVDPSFEQALNEAITQAQQRSTGHALLALPVPSLPGDNKAPNTGQLRYAYWVDRRVLPDALKLRHSGLLGALYLAGDTPRDKLERLVKSSFGLTDAETNVTLELASGQPLKVAAEHLSISVNTARNHLQSVFEKSGIKRQSELILVVTQLSVVLASTVIKSGEEQPVRVQDADYPRYEFALTPNGRRIAYRRYGEGARTVVYLHETAGCSRLLPGTPALATKHDLTIIAVERPGYGFTDPSQQDAFQQCAEDLDALLRQLDLTRVTVLGWLSGGSHAIFCAANIPDRIEQVWLVSGRPPARMATARMAPLSKLRGKLVDQPWMLNTFFNILRNRASSENNRRLLSRVYGSSAADKRLLEQRPLILEHLTASTLESFAVSANGIVQELRAFADPPTVDPDTVTAPILALHGSEDAVADPAAMEAFLSTSPHNVEIWEGEGVLMIYKYWPELLARIAE